MPPMHSNRRWLATFLLMVLPAGCGLNLYSEAEEANLGLQAYQFEIGKYRQITTGPDYDMVQRVFQKITRAAHRDDFAWEFRLLESDKPNAFCLPGGKVAIFTGILPLTQSEDGLAAVMGHEVAHATMRHGGQRMTGAQIMQAVSVGLDAGLSIAEMNEDVRNSVLAAFGTGAPLYLLSYSRGHETEADEEGIRYAIRAGYDPYAAVDLWQRMARASGVANQPEWLSTHPHSLERAANLEKMIPRILAEERDAATRRR